MTEGSARTTLQLGLPGDALWQVCWFGALCQMATGAAGWGIHVYFTQHGIEAGQVPGRLVERPVSLAHMNLLPIGRLVRGHDSRLLGVLPLVSAYSGRVGQRRVMDLDFSQANTSPVRRSSLGSANSNRQGTHEAQYDALLVRVAASSTTPEVLVPCATLYQYFWGSSSRVARLITTGELEHLDRFVCKQDETWMNEAGRFHLVLRKGMLDQDAAYLATLLSQPYAIEAGCRIWRSIVESTRGEGTRTQAPMLDVIPPFPQKLRVIGFFSGATADPQSTQYLTHIVASDLRPEWNELIFRRENDGHRAEATASEPKLPSSWSSYPRRTEPRVEDQIDIDEYSPNESTTQAELPLLPAYQWRFPELASIPKVKLRSTSNATQRTNQVMHVSFVPGAFSAIDGVPLGGGAVGSAELNPDKSVTFDEAPDQVGEDGEAPSDRTPIHGRTSDFAALFREMGPQIQVGSHRLDVQVHFMDPYAGGSRSRVPRFFKVPSMVDGQRLAWLYRDPDERERKHGVCIELRAASADGPLPPRYILDFEPRQPRPRAGAGATPGAELANGFLAVWFDRALDDGELFAQLSEVVSCVALRGNPRLNVRPADFVNSRAFRHTQADAQTIARRVLAAVDQCAAGDDLASMAPFFAS